MSAYMYVFQVATGVSWRQSYVDLSQVYKQLPSFIVALLNILSPLCNV
jgi:hypothetical protein